MMSSQGILPLPSLLLSNQNLLVETDGGHSEGCEEFMVDGIKAKVCGRVGMSEQALCKVVVSLFLTVLWGWTLSLMWKPLSCQ